jgi:CDP-6-deoxy-D-xylo-4-hexulose-3-dehydrase
LKLKFVDVDLQTLNFNLDDLARAISPSTRAILAVNLLGNPNDFKVIRSLIEGRDICLLEDNCESIGAKFQGEYAGCIGLMGTFSTFFSHHISTMEGGVLVTDDEELYHISLSLRAHGWTRNLPKVNRVTGLKSDSAFEESYKFILPGYNLRPLELSGAIGQHQLHKLPAIIRNRRENASTFSGIIRDYEWLISQRETGESSWFGFSLIVRPESGKNRKTLTEALDYHGIEYRPIVAGNFLKNPVISYFDYEVFGSMSNANTIDTHGLFIGNHHYDMCNEFIVLQEALESCCR